MAATSNRIFLTQVLVPHTQMLTNTGHSTTVRLVLLSTYFILWRERGARFFRDSNKGIQELVDEVLDQLKFTDSSAFH